MKTICLQTELPNKYLSTYLLDADWEVLINNQGTSMQNKKTNENVFILDIYSGNALLVDLEIDPPEDWAPRCYYYLLDTKTWEPILPANDNQTN